MIINPYAFGGGGALGTLYDEIMSDSPAFYFRLNETSGTNANNETGGSDATYTNGPTLNQAAIYTGGDVCTRLSGGTQLVDIPSSLLSSTSSLTLGIVIQPQSVSGFQSILSKDPSSGREWQWRMNGTSLEFVKIVGGVQTLTATSVFTNGVSCIVHAVISGTSIVMYKNGASVLSDTIGSVNYGVFTSNIAVGYQDGPGAGLNAFVCEAFGCMSALSAARVLAHAQAAGFA